MKSTWPQNSPCDMGIVITADREAAKRKRPTDLTAYDLFLLGSAALYREAPEDNKQAIALLKRSLEVDPSLARAAAVLSLAYFQQTHLWRRQRRGPTPGP